MIIHWPSLLVAIVLLWLPRSWMRLGSLWRGRSRRHNTNWTAAPQDGSSLSYRREFLKLRNYFDFARAFAAALTLCGGMGVTPAIALDLPTRGTSLLLAMRLGLIAVGTIFQVLRYDRRRISLAAPVFYLAGLLFVLCSPWAGLCGFVVAWVMSAIVPNAQGFLSIQAAVSGAFALLLNGIALLPLGGAVICFLPVLLSLLARKPLIVFSRRGSVSGRSFKT